MKKQDEKLADSGLKELGVQPRIYYFDSRVTPFTAITVATETLTWISVRSTLDGILSGLRLYSYEKATRLMKELHARRIYGVVICEHRDQFNRRRGRTIAKGRLLEFLRAVRRTEERKDEIEKEKLAEKK
jgi:hypothetical protein